LFGLENVFARQKFNNMTHLKFYLADLNSPTSCQLSNYFLQENWQEVLNLEEANFSSSQLDYPELEQLEFKHLLSEFLSPELSWMQPITRYLDEWNWQSVLNNLSQEYSQTPQAWILKPSLLNNGQHIKLFSSLDAIYAYYGQAKRLGGPHVLQAYISNPHLLKGPVSGHKYSLRLFFVMTESNAYLYPHGYFNIALTPYILNDFSNLSCHLTNEHLSHDEINVVQIPTFQYPMFTQFFPQIYEMVRKLSNKFFLNNQLSSNFKLGLLGVDFMVDMDERVWLLEINHGPCFPKDKSHPLYEKLYDGFWRSLITEILIPRCTENKTQPNQFILL
jgi:hypothetical protein